MAGFRSSARTVDMLGRQQIADTATAITELWKNGYDAYATRAIAYHLVDEDLLVISDDGHGMSHDIFVDRWLTLGTSDKQQKVASTVAKDFARSRGLPGRAVMGEKGIGRLALALLGTQALVVSRGEDAEGRLETTSSWLCWDLFELPGLMLDDIPVPVRTSHGSDLELSRDLQELRAEMLAGISQARSGATELDEPARLECLKGLDAAAERVENLDLDIAGVAKQLNLPIRHGHGTSFFVLPVSEQLDEDVKRSLGARTMSTESRLDPADSKFFRLVRDFIDNLSDYDGRPQPEFDTNYVILRGVDDVLSLRRDELRSLDPWITADLELADHVFEGRFDEYGHWRGEVSIYGRDAVDYEVVNMDAEGRETACGPFYVTIGYVEPSLERTRLSSSDHAAMQERLARASGLYVFRDGIRVLPYGSYDLDYLGIEERRSKNVGRYYFSYRNMFGAVSLTSAENGALKEKAGREGFRQDKAFRHFRKVLINLLRGLAADFLSTSAASDDDSIVGQVRDELKKRHEAAKQADKRAEAQRRAFARKLTDAARQLAEAPAAIDEVVEAAEQDAHGSLLEFDVNRWLDRLDATTSLLPLAAPPGVGLDAAVRDELAEVNQRHHQDVAPLHAKARARIAELAVDANVYEAVEVLASRADDQLASVEAALDDALQGLASVSRERLQEVREHVQKVVAAPDLIAAQEAMSDVETSTRAFEEVVEQIQRASEDIESRTSLLVVDAVRQEQIAQLEAQADINAELAQVGMAVAIISHEFQSNITGIREQLRRLRRWGRSNADLKRLATDLTASFEHLDGYLRLFTPLQRRLHRSSSKITGIQIAEYLEGLFEERLQKIDASLEVTSGFKQMSVTGYPSTFYPVFVNIVDNALHWLETDEPPRRIVLDRVGDGFAIANNGPPIPDRNRARIFSRGFTTRSGGRGLGLHLAREALRNSGWELVLGDPDGQMAVVFIIRPRDEGDES